MLRESSPNGKSPAEILPGLRFELTDSADVAARQALELKEYRLCEYEESSNVTDKIGQSRTTVSDASIQIVRDALTAYLGVDRDLVRGIDISGDLRDIVGLDSLDIVELVAILETEYGVDMDLLFLGRASGNETMIGSEYVASIISIAACIAS